MSGPASKQAQAAPKFRTGQKRSLNDDGLLPATRPRISEPSSNEKISAWQEPQSSVSVDAWEEMAAMIPWLQQSLLAGLSGNVAGYEKSTSLAALEPGKIQSLDDSVSASFREAWSLQNCQAALQKYNQYEAAGSLWWLQLFPDKEEQQLVFDNLEWEAVCEFSETFARDKVENSFVPFNVIIPAFRFRADVALQDFSAEYPKGLSVCQGALLPCWALLLAISRAFLAQDWEHLQKLMACSRSIPLRLQIIEDSVSNASVNRAFGEKGSSRSLIIVL